jgi:hypothetical protein
MCSSTPARDRRTEARFPVLILFPGYFRLGDHSLTGYLRVLRSIENVGDFDDLIKVRAVFKEPSAK